MSFEEFREDLLSGLGTVPNNKFEFHRFTHPSKQEVRARRDRESETGENKHIKLHFRIIPFDHRELETGDELAKYVSFTTFHANLNLPESESSHMYLLGTLQNVAMMAQVYPGWVPLVYLDETSYRRYKETYESYIYFMLKARPDTLVVLVTWKTSVPHHKALSKKYHLTVKPHDDLAELVAKYKDRENLASNTKLQFIKTMWRFFPASYRVVSVYRDTDSRVNMREALAVNEWVNSNYPLHRIFDSVFYANPLLAGLWGSKPQCPHIVSVEGKSRDCSTACVAIPNIEQMIYDFLTPDNLMRGYGIDELFLGMEAKLSQARLYTDVMTHGYGGFFSSTDSSFSLFKNYQSIKLGRRMNTLMPCGGTKFAGYEKAFRKLPSGTYLGFDTSFVGENIVMNESDSCWVNLIIEETMAYAVGEQPDNKWADKLKRFKIQNKPQTFEKHLDKKSINAFTDHYGFDKRFFPQFWYCFDRVLMHESFTFTRIYTTNPDEYEIRVLEDAYRTAALKYPAVHNLLTRKITNHEYYDKYYPYLIKIYDRNISFQVDGLPVGKFFMEVKKVIEALSHVFPYLQSKLKYEYIHGALTYYPFSALRVVNLEF